ncbi:MAG: hypothetical protein Q4F31_10520 [Eubacteriales bacterium]|nr:hypothetical protein [Eubacteriales bacterium]
MSKLLHREKPGTEKSIGILEKYYNIDHENKTVFLPFSYGTEDALAGQRHETKRALFNDSVLCGDIASVMRDVPGGYFAEAEIQLDASVPLSAEEAGESMTDALEIKLRSLAYALRSKYLKECLLVFFGCLLLWFSYDIKNIQLSNYSDIISFFYNGFLLVFAQAMIWEFIILVVPATRRNMGDAELVFRKTRRITISDSRGDSFSLDMRALISSCSDFNKRFAAIAQCFLILSLLIFNHGMASSMLTIDILDGTLPFASDEYKILYLALNIACSLLTSVCAVTDCFCYARRGRWIKVFPCLLILLTASEIGFNILDYVIPVLEDPAFIAKLSPGVFLVDLVNFLLVAVYIALSFVFLHSLKKRIGE